MSGWVDEGAVTVDSYLGTGWPQTSLVLAPATTAQYDALVPGPAPDRPDVFAAVTTDVRTEDGGGDVVVLNPTAREELVQETWQVTVTHELVHVASGALYGDGQEVWLAEGVADLVGWSGVVPGTVGREQVAGRLLDRVDGGLAEVQELPGATDFAAADADEVGDAYEGAWLAALLLQDELGVDGLLAVYEDASDGPGTARQRTDDALRTATGRGAGGVPGPLGGLRRRPRRPMTGTGRRPRRHQRLPAPCGRDRDLRGVARAAPGPGPRRGPRLRAGRRPPPTTRRCPTRWCATPTGCCCPARGWPPGSRRPPAATGRGRSGSPPPRPSPCSPRRCVARGRAASWPARTGTRCGGRACPAAGRRCGGSATPSTCSPSTAPWCGARSRAGSSPDAAGRVVLLSPGVDADRFAPRGGGPAGPSDAPVVLCLSRAVPRKGHARLLAVWPELRRRHPGARLVLAGSGPELPALRRTAAGLPGVDVLGRVAEADLPALYAAADVFVLPVADRLGGLVTESLGIVLLEAAAAGLPVVSGRAGGTAEAVLHERTGLLLDDATDHEQLVGAVDRLLGDEALRRRFGEAGRAWVRSAWTWDRTAARLSALLDGEAVPRW